MSRTLLNTLLFFVLVVCCLYGYSTTLSDDTKTVYEKKVVAIAEPYLPPILASWISGTPLVSTPSSGQLSQPTTADPSVLVPTPTPISIQSLLAGATPKETFSGQGPLNTHPFAVQGPWKLVWYSTDKISITLCSFEGKPDVIIVPNPTAPCYGSANESAGGQYYLKVEGTANWTVALAECGGAVQPTAPPVAINPFVAVSAPLPTPSPTPSPAAAIDASVLQNAVVIVKGDDASGTGFLIKRDDGIYVVTNQHVLSNNRNITFQCATGQNLTVTGLLGATDRDLALVAVKNPGNLVTLPTVDSVAAKVANTDPTMVTGNSMGGGVLQQTTGTVIAVGPVRLEVSNSLLPGNSGSPVIDTKLQAVVAVATEVVRYNADDFFNAQSSVRYFSLRFDDVPKWEPMNINAFYNQTHLLETFDTETEQVAALIEDLNKVMVTPGTQLAAGRPYTDNPKLMELLTRFSEAIQSSKDRLVDADAKDQLQQLGIDLGGFAQKDVNLVQEPGNFYTYNKHLAKEEMDRRQPIIDTFQKFVMSLDKGGAL